MEKQNKVKIICDQLKGLFDSLDKKSNYRKEIIDDYRKIISNLDSVLSLNNLKDYNIPVSALESSLYISPFEERLYDGGIVRSKIKQLIAVLESEYQIIENKSKNDDKSRITSSEEITLMSLIKKDFKKIPTYLDSVRSKVEENLLTKIIILIGAVGAGFLIIVNFFW